MTEQDIIHILRSHEQLLYLPKNARKNPLTRGVIEDRYKAIAGEILSSSKFHHMNTTHPAHQRGAKPPSAGRIVMYFHNGNDAEAAVNGADFYPAMVIQAWGTHIANMRVFTYSEGAPLLRSSVPHKGEHNPGQPYWDWPEIK